LNVHVVLDVHVDGFTSKVCSVDELKYTCVQLGDIRDKYLMFP